VRYDLAAAIEVARLADSAGGTIAPDLLAPALGYSGTNNGAYLSRVASARLFGVVSGRGPRLELTERGRRILDGSAPDASLAKSEAFLAVPLFRAVADAVEQRAGRLPDDLADWLVDEFGEVAGKAQTVADQLIASGGQAGLIRRTEMGKLQLSTSLTKFTSVDNLPSHEPSARLRLRRSTRSPQGEEVAVAEDGLWLDEESGKGPRRGSSRRRVGVVAAAAAVLIVAAVPIALVVSGATPQAAPVHRLSNHPHLGNGPAEHEVLSALSATTDSGSFDFSYSIASTPPSSTPPTTTSTTDCHQVKEAVPTGPVASSSQAAAVPLVISSGTSGGANVAPSPTKATSAKNAPKSAPRATAVSPTAGTVVLNPGGTAVNPGGPMVVSPTTSGTLPPGYQWRTEEVCSGGPTEAENPTVNGSGVINTNPLGMVASANIGGGLDVTVRVDGTDVYEGSTGDTGLAPQGGDASGSGSTLPGFAGLTEGTLGTREGAVAMMGMASPTGYLDLIQPAVDAASETGTGTVDGAPVTIYQVTDNLDQLAAAAGTTSAESQTISAALTLLKAQGYTANTALVSIDNGGYIRQVKSTDTFSDGSSVTLQATFSDFGCAGTVLMPGQSGAGVPPAGCTSPDGPIPSTTTPSTVAPRTSASIPGTTPTTVAPHGSSTTTVPTTTTVGSSVPEVGSVPVSATTTTIATSTSVP
jgi:hypothetical protein